MTEKTLTPIIGMEVHIELMTKSKMFCGCPADHFGKLPNTQTCPVCLGLPGALPVPNQKAIDWTIMIGHALGCRINFISKFDRKHYFYPDLPKGYQISQYDQPFCSDGTIDLASGKVRIHRIHLEEDTGKLQHKSLNGEKVSLVDFNRSSVPLVEIVTEPDFKSADHAFDYVVKLQQLVRYLGVSDADMEKGSMRLEANISLTDDPNELPSYKVEVKNLNSFKFLKQAIDYEIVRQSRILDSGEIPAQETRGWSESKNQTISQRSKEEAQDYRYFPEPDIPPLKLSDKYIKGLQNSLPLLPDDYRQIFLDEFEIRSDYIDIILADPKMAKFCHQLLSQAKSSKLQPADVINYVVNSKINPDTISPKELLQIITAENNKESADESQVQNWCRQVISENPDIVAKYRAGKTSVIGALIGQVMKLSRGTADAKATSNHLKKFLDSL